MAAERELTAKLAEFFPSHRDVLVGIGDDAAVLRRRHDRLVMCCDPVVEGVHFVADTPPALVGRKAVNRNLSDLAAMGAVPDWLQVSLVFPRTQTSRQLMSLLGGIRRAAAAAGCVVVGGDTASSDGPLVVTVSAYGHLQGRALTRSRAKAGDTLHVTGPLGGSILGHHLRFRPALREGQWLAGQAAVAAAMDVSDGLILDLQTMLEASRGPRTRLGAELYADQIPIRRAARQLKGDPLQHALRDGEDHVLLWAQRPATSLGRGGPLSSRARRPIGRILAEPGLWLVVGDSRRRLKIAGYEHGWQSAVKKTQ